MAAKRSVLSIEGLKRSFKGREVIRSLSLDVDPGERVALLGANGSGKTTVLRCIAGTLLPTAGTVDVGGHPAGALEARRLVGASLSQDRSFYLRLSGYTNLLFYARLRCESESEAEHTVRALGEELALGPILATRVDRCSSGMVQQLAFARALLADPTVLVLDEPTRSLDTEARKRLWDALERRPGAALVYATHLDEDLAHCDRHVNLPA